MTPAHRTKEAPRAAAFPRARASRRICSPRLKNAISLAVVQSLLAGAARLSLPQNADAEALSLRASGACIDATEALDRLWLARPRPGRDARTRGHDFGGAIRIQTLRRTRRRRARAAALSKRRIASSRVAHRPLYQGSPSRSASTSFRTPQSQPT